MDELVKLIEIRSSEATLTGTEVLEIFYALLNGQGEDWLAYRSDIHIGTARLAQIYANKHGLIETKLVRIYTHSPLHVLREYNTTIKIDDTEENGSLDGILFSNGCVFLLETHQGIRTFLWVSPETAKIFDYPMPEDTLEDKPT